MLQLIAELGVERRIRARRGVSIAQLVERLRERLGDEHAAVRAEVPARIREVINRRQVIRPHFRPLQ
jgi:hypothetical protein